MVAAADEDNGLSVTGDVDVGIAAETRRIVVDMKAARAAHAPWN